MKIIYHHGTPVIVTERGEMRPMKEDEVFEIIKKKERKRSVVANAALHLFFAWIAEALRDSGYTIQSLLAKKPISHSWTDRAVKEIIWRPIQEGITGKKSSTNITSSEIKEISDEVHLYLSEIGLDIGFPSREQMLELGSTKGYRAA